MKKPDLLDKRLHAPHTTGCTIRRYSDRENRRCSCGYVEAIEQAANLRQIKILVEYLSRAKQLSFTLTPDTDHESVYNAIT